MKTNARDSVASVVVWTITLLNRDYWKDHRAHLREEGCFHLKRTNGHILVGVPDRKVIAIATPRSLDSTFTVGCVSSYAHATVLI
jgi:hypothetical protein